MFYGREKELKKLNQLYASNQFEFTVIYGRRRVGKTEIIKEFAKENPCIFFTGVESNEKQNLENFSKSIMEFQTSFPMDASFTSFQMALEYVFELAKQERILLVIDEYPYVARASKSLASILQLLIDRYKDNSKLFVILCGSSMSYMEDHVLAYKAPLYGRRTAQLKVQPFEFREALQWYKSFQDIDKAIAYGMLGGTPQYLLQIDDTKSIEENIKSIFLNPMSIIFEEPVNLLKQEVREPAIYNAIITAVAKGYTKLSEISSKAGVESSVCSIYIKNLVTLGILKKEYPTSEDTTRKTIYSIEDFMFRFWYRFLPSNQSLISRGAIDQVYQRIESQLSDYMGGVFEEICKQYLWEMLVKDEIPIFFHELGRWWGNDPRTKSQIEIDILGIADNKQAIFGECKWRNELVDSSVLETLVWRSQLFPMEKVMYYLFSKSGFTKGCMELAEKMENVVLVSYEEML